MCGHYEHAKNKSAIVKRKLISGQKQLHYTANTIFALCKHVHIKHANAYLAKNRD